MGNRWVRAIIVSTAAACIFFAGCYNAGRSSPPQEPQSQNNGDYQMKQQSSQSQNGSETVILDAPIISQKPELLDGCEVSSLAMLLQYAGVNVDKMTLAKKVKKDTTPIVKDKKGDIKIWGNPHEGFVGDITGKRDGFAVYHKPLLELLEQYLPGRGVDLTGQPFEELLRSIDNKKPVVVWSTIDFKLPDSYEEWKNNGEEVKATFDEHAVLLVGYDHDSCYVNNPYTGKKNQQVKKEDFIKSWNSIGSQAISYKDAPF
jgi:uncharacterized protein YvpB